MQSIFAPVGDLGVNGPHAGPLSGPLGHTQGLFQVAIEAPAFEFVTVAAGRCSFQSKVDAHGALAWRKLAVDLDHDVEIPASASVLVEAAGAELVVGQAVTIPDLEVPLVEDDLAVFPDCGAGFERYPAQATPGAA